MTVLNFSKAKQFNGLQESMPDLIVFIKPLGSIFHRVFTLPKEPKEKIAELKQALTDLCNREINNVWFFDLRKEQHEDDIYQIIASIGFPCISVKLDNDPEQSN